MSSQTPAASPDAPASKQTQTTTSPLSKAVVLRVGCTDITKRDAFSQSDPFIVVYLSDVDSEQREIARTMTATNMVSVLFKTEIHINYKCEQAQKLRLEVYDRDSPSEQLDAHAPLGCAELMMDELMTARGLALVLPLQQPQDKHIPGLKGTVTITAEELSTNTDKVTVQFGADNLDRKNGWFGKSDPFLAIERLNNADADPAVASSWLSVWTSEFVKSTLSPRWEKSTISLRTLCNGDLTRVLHFRIFDWEADGNHEVIGGCTMTAGEFLTGERLSLDLINEERKAKKGTKYVNSGVLRILSLEKHK